MSDAMELPPLPEPFAFWTTGPRGGFMAERERRPLPAAGERG
ncbi:hypothetical protein [Acetobacter sacchari]|nr:hypothetical protein [Acetobacter sacchari]